MKYLRFVEPNIARARDSSSTIDRSIAAATVTKQYNRVRERERERERF